MKYKILLLSLALTYVISLHAQVNDTIIKYSPIYDYNSNKSESLNSFQSQLFGEPRTPLKTSFYSEEMLKYDWLYQDYGRFIDPINYTLLGIQNQIKTNGNVIVYDASVTSIPDNPTLTTNGIDVLQNEVFVITSDRSLLIPIRYLGDNSIDGNILTKSEQKIISEYVNKSLAYSGITPSNISITANNGDFNISIVKSNFTNEDIIIEGYNIRSKASKYELLEKIKNAIEYVDLEKAKENLTIASDKFPHDTEFHNFNERYEELKQLNFINSQLKTCAIRLIEESSKEFIVHNGLNPNKTYSIQNKSDFIQDLINSINKETNVIYLDIRGLSDEKSEAFVISTNIQIKAIRPDIVIKAVPKDETLRKLFFEGEILQKSLDTQPNFNDYSGIQIYDVRVESKLWKISLGLEVIPSIIRTKSKNLVKSFFQTFDKRISKNKGWNLSEAVNSTRKEVQKRNKGIRDEDYETFIRNELLGTNIVFIEIIEEGDNLIAARIDKE